MKFQYPYYMGECFYKRYFPEILELVEYIESRELAAGVYEIFDKSYTKINNINIDHILDSKTPFVYICYICPWNKVTVQYLLYVYDNKKYLIDLKNFIWFFENLYKIFGVEQLGSMNLDYTLNATFPLIISSVYELVRLNNFIRSTIKHNIIPNYGQDPRPHKLEFISDITSVPKNFITNPLYTYGFTFSTLMKLGGKSVEEYKERFKILDSINF